MRTVGAVMLVAAIVSGCATQTTQRPFPDAAVRSAVADSFTLRGKMGIRTATAGHSARLVWHQRHDAFDIELSGPVGIGRTTLVGTPQTVTISDRDGRRAYDDPGRALETELGWSPPLEALRYWAVGLPHPDMTFETLAPATDQSLAGFEQAGWTVSVEQMSDYGQWTLPRKLTLTRGQTRLRLVISRWQVPATTD
jgi:outer membrane lipoprotein LolB